MRKNPNFDPCIYNVHLYIDFICVSVIVTLVVPDVVQGIICLCLSFR